METRLLPTDPAALMKQSVGEAVALLQRGEVVVLPTETVYGLAGDIHSPKAIAGIFEAKERPSFDPLIVHIPRKDSLRDVAIVDESIEKVLQQLMNVFWPGPLTFILPKKPNISDSITAGLPTVAVRMPADPVFKRVLHEFGSPLAAPSANRFGRISPTSASAALEELNGRVPLILDGGACSTGIESTIIRIEPAERKPLFHILRNGPITADDLKPYGRIVKKRSLVTIAETPPTEGWEAPGQTDSHYAPLTPLRLLAQPSDFQPEPGKRYALLSYRGLEEDGYLELTEFEETAVLSPGSGKVPEAAVRLFFLMRQLDQLGVDEIIAEPVPDRGVGAAIMERLRRASVKGTEA